MHDHYDRARAPQPQDCRLIEFAPEEQPRSGDPVEAVPFRGDREVAVDNGAPAGIPVTVKMRKGIDDGHLTHVHAGAAQEVAAMVSWSAADV